MGSALPQPIPIFAEILLLCPTDSGCSWAKTGFCQSSAVYY